MFGALKRGFRSMVSLILVRNVVGELRPKRTLTASRGFLAAARLSCEYMLLPVRPSLRLSVCLSVRLSLSVTPVYQSRTVKVMIMQFSLSL